VISLQFVGPDPGNPERRVIHDFEALRGQLATVEHFGAYRDADHNLVAAETAPEPVEVAEISPSAFALTGVAAVRGRYLLPDDESPSAAPVVVIGHKAWQVRFAGDPGVVGRTISLGGVHRTIVGVMPEGYEFPVRHDFWVPLREESLKYPRWEGPRIYMFGRLGPGVTIEQAQAEFSAVPSELLLCIPRPGTPCGLWSFRTRTNAPTSPSQPSCGCYEPVQLLVGVLAVVVAINLAILVYARTMSRLGELP
jgi:hypothetical protein